MADTLGDMLDDIGEETRYDDSASRIIHQKLVMKAIAHYEKENFWFNQSRSVTFNTVANQRAYGSADNASIPYVQDFDAVTFTRATNDSYTLTKRDWVVLEDLNPDSDSTGPAQWYAYWEKQIWLDPVPDAVYAVRVAGIFKQSVLSTDTDSNSWTTVGEGEALIRSRAKVLWYSQYVRDDANATRAAKEEIDAELELKAATIRRNGTSQIRMSL